ncbi:hypothetical protein Droror1_Dr00020881 [Drosera rotundifolia]
MSCGLEDLKYTGCHYTWYNNQSADTWMYIKLDRVLYYSLWLEQFLFLEALFLESDISDHSPMLVNFHHDLKVSRPFLFLNMWSKNKRFKGIIQSLWPPVEAIRTLLDLNSAIKKLKQPLQDLHRSCYSDISDRVKKAEEDLLDSQHALKCCFTQEGKELVVLNTETYRGLLEAENAYIQQMMNEDWLNFMDRNTKFFHDVIRSRRKRGLILSLHNGPGDIINV